MWCKTIWLPKQRGCAKSAINFTSTLPLIKNFSNTPENSHNGFPKSKVTCMEPYLKGLYQMSFPGNLTQCFFKLFHRIPKRVIFRAFLCFEKWYQELNL